MNDLNHMTTNICPVHGTNNICEDITSDEENEDNQTESEQSVVGVEKVKKEKEDTWEKAYQWYSGLEKDNMELKQLRLAALLTGKMLDFKEVVLKYYNDEEHDQLPVHLQQEELLQKTNQMKKEREEDKQVEMMLMDIIEDETEVEDTKEAVKVEVKQEKLNNLD